MTTKLNRTRVKVCGITRPQDAREIVTLGVDALGLILHADSPRKITIEQAQRIRAEVPAFVTLVGVFVDCPSDTINNYAKRIGLDLIQLHGDESNTDGQALNSRFIKAIRAKSPEQVQLSISSYPDASAVLLDPYVKGQHGGTGQSLDPSLWPEQVSTGRLPPLILAGGLAPENIAKAVSQLQPYAVDINSGVEISPGVKNLEMVAATINALSQ